MRKLIAPPARRIRRALIDQVVRQGRRLEARYNLPPRPYTPLPEVARALALPAAGLADPAPGPTLTELLPASLAEHTQPSSREIFALDGQPLPCWQESDVELYDDWLTAPNYYPVYYHVFKRLADADRPVRMLEIGVRTGYMGVAFARAARGRCMYVGVDPNLYVRHGLHLAADTFRILRERLPLADFALIEGFSWDTDVQRSLTHSGPFDIIHIDGDHTVPGKLVDLELARRLLAPGGVVLVDDYEHHSIVADAIRRAWRLGWYSQFGFVPTKRGLAVLR